MLPKSTKDVNVTVTSVLYPREPSDTGGFCVIRTNIGTCKGSMPYSPKAGMQLTLTGSYGVYHGQKEFRFVGVKQNIPIDKLAMLDYVAKFAKGVGPATVSSIKAHFGENWEDHLDDVEEFPPKYSIPIKRALDILRTDKVKLDTIVYIIGIGGSPRIGQLAYDKWGRSAIATVSEFPYKLAELDGVGFKTVDEFMSKHTVGFKKHLMRACAAIEYAVNYIVEKTGDTVVEREHIYGYVSKEFNVDRELVGKAVCKLVDEGKLEFVGLDMLTLKKYAEYDNELIVYATKNRTVREDVLISRRRGNITLDDSQLDAVETVLARDGLSVINGRAGCGKTTIIKTICNELEKIGESVSICAFAGKAAARLREATGHHSTTIHSMLGWIGEGKGFQYGELCNTSVIVDEASMVPSWLMFEIVKRNPKRLVLVGDQAQIQPVGAGQPFHDIIKLFPSLVSTVTTCYRNKEAVFQQASKIRDGIPPCNSKSENEYFEVITYKSPEEVQKAIEDIDANGRIDFSEDLVLAPRNGEGSDAAPATVGALNNALQNIENPHRCNEKFKPGDRIIGTKNSPKYKLWNGTTGWVSRVDEDGCPFVTIDDEPGAGEQRLTKDVAKTLAQAYALTIHKAQGSQYRNVYIVVLKRDMGMLLDRSLLYTAVTRSRRGCVILTDCDLSLVCRKVRERRTVMQEKVNSAIYF